MQTLPFLVAEMRQLGIRRLELELEPAVEGDTITPPVGEPAVEKSDGVCAFGDCQAAREGILGGIAKEYCRAHALEAAGVKT